MDIYKELQEIFVDVFDDESIVVTPELSASEVDGWDSLAQIRLIETIESAFGFMFDMDELERAKNVGDMVEVIKKNITQQSYTFLQDCHPRLHLP